MNRSNKVYVIKELIDFLKKEGGISVKVAAEKFGISEVTARRYMNEIASMDLPVKRVRGGLVLETIKGSVEFMFDMKLSLNEPEKKRIAKKALEFIEDGDSILLDSGTTVFQLAKLFRSKKGLKVITVDVKIAEELGKNPEIETYIIGGLVRPGYFSIGGEMALEFLERFKVEKAFLTADAVHPEEGITNSSMFEAFVKKLIVRSGKKVILIADHTKVGKVAFVKVVPMNAVNIFITSKGADENLLSKIEELGVKVIVV